MNFRDPQPNSDATPLSDGLGNGHFLPMPPKSLTHLNDFPPEKSTIYAYCPCGQSAAVDRDKLGNAEIQTPASWLGCSECGGRAISSSIVYTGAGEFHHS
jgi:hypothetical protein